MFAAIHDRQNVFFNVLINIIKYINKNKYL